MMNGPRQSDCPIVPANAPNKAGQLAAEGREGRGLAKGKLNRHNMPIGLSAATGMLSVLVRVRHVSLHGYLASSPAVRAGCGSAARPVPCGGRAERPVPTATILYNMGQLLHKYSCLGQWKTDKKL